MPFFFGFLRVTSSLIFQTLSWRLSIPETPQKFSLFLVKFYEKSSALSIIIFLRQLSTTLWSASFEKHWTQNIALVCCINHSNGQALLFHFLYKLLHFKTMIDATVWSMFVKLVFSIQFLKLSPGLKDTFHLIHCINQSRGNLSTIIYGCINRAKLLHFKLTYICTLISNFCTVSYVRFSRRLYQVFLQILSSIYLIFQIDSKVSSLRNVSVFLFSAWRRKTNLKSQN